MCLGPSMLPTFNRSGDVVLMERVSVMTGGVERGDVVIARSPANPRHTVCKRVLGKEGDIIAVPKAGNFGGTLRVEVPRVLLDHYGADELRLLVLSQIARGPGGVPNAIRIADAQARITQEEREAIQQQSGLMVDLDYNNSRGAAR